MSEFKTFMNEHNFETVMINNHQYFRDRKYESDPNYHDCGIIDGKICGGCRACIYTRRELHHSFLVYLIEDLLWSNEQLSKYFDLSYVNLDKHRSQYPGGCQCNFQKMFRHI